MQKEMVDILQSEGFQINDRELMRVRLRFKWLLRERRGKGEKRKANADASARKSWKRDKNAASGSEVVNQIANDILQDGSSDEEGASGDEQDVQTRDDVEEESEQTHDEPAPLNPEEALRRQIRHEQLQIESAEKWRTRKRRRRTRGWAGLPADAPGEPPRFPSETTLDESKAYLSLDNTLYRQVRQQFQAICEEENVTKKTMAGPDKWAQLKHRLIGESEHLSNVFDQDPEAKQQIGTMPTPSNSKALSIDVICTDVTKRMRILGSRMSIPEAKNILGLNPEQTRKVRTAFLNILKIDHFTNKYETGDQHWVELKEAWIKDSDLLTQTLAGGDTDPKHAEKTRAVEVLARDVMKRLRAENCQKDPSQKKQINQGPGPGPAPPTVASHSSRIRTNARNGREESGVPNTTQASLDLTSLSSSSDLQIDPSLLLAASDPSLIPDAQNHIQQHSQHHPQPQSQHGYAFAPPPPSQFLPSLPLPIYFRLHPHSSTSLPHKTVWLGILQSGRVAELRSLAMREHPGTVIVRIEGLIVHKINGMQGQGQVEREAMIPIEEEDELAAYLEHATGSGGNGKATFVVLMAPAAAAGAGGQAIGRGSMQGQYV